MKNTARDTLIIDGKARAASILEDLKTDVIKFEETYAATVTLAIILVGNNPASEIYVKNKIKTAIIAGIKTELIRFSNSVTNDELVSRLKELNNDQNISGIIVQMPLPDHIDKRLVINSVSPVKDVDGFTLRNIGAVYSAPSMESALTYEAYKKVAGKENYDNAYHVACTARGALDLILSVEPKLKGKHAVIIGRSNIVGRPMAALLLQNDCTVTIAHSGTTNLEELSRSGDIVVSAIGKSKFLTREYFMNDAIVIDVGISRVETNEAKASKIIGDVDFQDVFGYVRALTPVPGGVGPMTIIYLLVNCLRAAQIAKHVNN